MISSWETRRSGGTSEPTVDLSRSSGPGAPPSSIFPGGVASWPPSGHAVGEGGAPSTEDEELVDAIADGSTAPSVRGGNPRELGGETLARRLKIPTTTTADTTTRLPAPAAQAQTGYTVPGETG